MDIVHDYVKMFSGMMLDIKYMFEEDKFFYFLEELKPWARIELQRQHLQDVATTKIAAKRLMHYAIENTQPKEAQSIAR